MVALGKAARQPAVIERDVRQIDLAPSLAAMLGVSCNQAAGGMLSEFPV
jgi:hypothetical protein